MAKKEYIIKRKWYFDEETDKPYLGFIIGCSLMGFYLVISKQLFIEGIILMIGIPVSSIMLAFKRKVKLVEI